MVKRLIVTGAHGFVAGSVISQAGDEWEVHAISRGKPFESNRELSWHSCDPVNSRDLQSVFRAIRPNAVIHTAAIADIDVAEQNRDLAWSVNVEFTRSLADLCADAGCKLVFCSTDTVFDGERAPYCESDFPEPVNYYGRTKVEAEQIVSALGTRGVVARLALVIGLAMAGPGNSFLSKMLRSLREGRPVLAPVREIRTPVDVVTAGKALLELAASQHHGTFHIAGNESLARLELAQRIARRLDLNADLVRPPGPGDSVRPAARPRDVSLNNAKARAELKTPMACNLDF